MKKRWTLKRYYAMCDWWAESGPPVYVSVAGYMGLLKPKKVKGAKTAAGSSNLRDLARMFASTGGKI